MACSLVIATVTGAVAGEPAALPSQGSVTGKKLIEFGWDEPDTAFMRQHAAEMDATPFDGCVYHVRCRQPDGKDTDFDWACWGKQAFTTQQVQQAVNDLKARRLRYISSSWERSELSLVSRTMRATSVRVRRGPCP
jgi:hypothetical protein